MTPVLVTSTAESTGKTAVTLALARAAMERGESVGYMKPKGTRLQSAVGKTLDEDPMLARELLGLDAEMHDLEPVVYSPTFVQEAIRGREDPDAVRERVRESYETLAADRDRMLVEGGGTLTTGGIVDLTDVDVAELLDAEVVLVSRYEEPGDVDDVLAAADALGDRLAGVLFNAVPDAAFDELATDVVPFVEGRGVRVLGTLPRRQELAGVTVAELADELGADLLTDDAATDAYVERFVVGAMGASEALTQFRRTRDAAMITGGDRTEIQTVALDAPGVECLLLTGGFRPPEAVLGRAEEAGVPVLLVGTDTITTIDRAEELVRSGRTRDERTVEAMGELLADYADVDALLPVEE
ncbi:phosphotransacetylase family protein [Halorarius halobius]|uniref:phosphotransacetylase family protein n=1 Tax=Halorarius halobius TaxID=2962671 RepID=UPI0020CECD66|nr:phosphotransacetylase family protein [Halorarius halobius]